MTESSERGRRKTRVGVVVSDLRDKTVTVEVRNSTRHPRYDKTIRRSVKLHAHDEANEAKIGDTVRRHRDPAHLPDQAVESDRDSRAS